VTIQLDPVSPNGGCLTTAELQSFRAAFNAQGVTLIWDATIATLSAPVDDHTNAVSHRRDGDLFAWLSDALNSINELRALQIIVRSS